MSEILEKLERDYKSNIADVKKLYKDGRKAVKQLLPLLDEQPKNAVFDMEEGIHLFFDHFTIWGESGVWSVSFNSWENGLTTKACAKAINAELKLYASRKDI